MKKSNHSKSISSQQDFIKRKLNAAGIKVSVGKKVPIKGEFSGIVGKDKGVLKLKV